jgi:hypothetical protein
VPLDRESERSTPEYAEVVSIVGIFPDVFAREDQIPPQRLLQAGVEFIAPAWTEGSGRISGTDKKRIQHWIGTSNAGKDQVLVEWGLQYPRIRNLTL